jgi:hypothetical protein
MPGDGGAWVMPDYMRMLTAEEAGNRRAYLAAHPDFDELTLAPNVSGYAPIADWVAAGKPGPGDCRCAHCRERYSTGLPGTGV